MNIRTLVNMSAAAVILAGSTLLSAARPAEATFAGGCPTMFKTIQEEATACNKLGGTYTWSGSCTDDHYDISSSCDVP